MSEQLGLALVDAPQAPRLRPYQLRALDEVKALHEMGTRRVLLVAPTGAGKTVIAAEQIRREREAGNRVLFLAPRRELIHQTVNKLTDTGVRCGVLLAGDARLNLYSSVQVASVDTLVSRVLRRNKLQLQPFDLVIVDEAHVGITETRMRLLELWPDARLIGLTATPSRSDGRALGQLYDELVQVATVQELTDAGYLVPGRYFSVSEPDLRGVRKVAGDYNLGDLDRVMNQSKLTGDIVEHWLRHAPTRRTVVFATSIPHSAALAAEFCANGVSAEHVDANTPQSEREAIFARFQSGATQVLTNCTLASIGFDLPELDCVVLARPTQSVALYLQMLGRGLRPAPGKRDCIVLDHAGCVLRHGFATEERFWTLHGKYAQDQQKVAEARKKKESSDEAKNVKCPECSCVFCGTNQCPDCGYVFPARQKRVEVNDGKLVELNGRKREWTPKERAVFYAELRGYADMKGYAPGWAAAKYKSRFNEWPSWKTKEWCDKHGGFTPSTETVRWVKADYIRWRKSAAGKAWRAARDAKAASG